MIISFPKDGLLNHIFPISIVSFPLSQATGAAVEEGVGQATKAPTAITGTADVDPERLW